MDTRTRWRRLSTGEPGAPLTDIGASTLTAVLASAAPRRQQAGLLGNGAMDAVLLTGAEARRLGSDCARAGFVFAGRPSSAEETEADGEFTDALGVRWLCADGATAPLRHPLHSAGPARIARHPRPEWPSRIQFPEPEESDLLVVADAPCPGLLDMGFALRDRWRFLEDIARDWRTASALLDWSLETIASAYERMLAALPRPPDIVVYADDYGHDGGMFISDLEFRNFIRPRLRTLLSRLRRRVSAAVCLHSCGAIRPIVRDIADLGVDLVSFDWNARGMGIAGLRRELPEGMILHGAVDLVALGRATDAGDFAALARLACGLADSAPAMAAPADCIGSPQDLRAAVQGAAFVKSLSEEHFHALRRLGPVKSVIEQARLMALKVEAPTTANKI